MPFKLLVMVLFEPNKAYTIVKERRYVAMFLPLLIYLIGTSLLLFWYYHIVDLGWLQHILLPAATEAQRQAMAKVMSPTIMSLSSIVGVWLVVPIIYLILAGYFALVAKVKGLAIGFGHWLAYVVWAGVPSLLLLPIGYIMILLTPSGQLSLAQLDPASLNQLFFRLPSTAGWGRLLDAAPPTAIWSYLLLVIGYRNWTSSTGVVSVLVPLAPYILFYGVWVLLIVLGGHA
jgi:hypothetical protein